MSKTALKEETNFVKGEALVAATNNELTTTEPTAVVATDSVLK